MSPDDPRHGSRAGYTAHRRAGQDACRPCKSAEAEYQRHRSRRRIKTPLSARRPGTCLVCRHEFIPGTGNQTYCSARCRQTARNQRRLPPQARREVVVGALVSLRGAYMPKPGEVIGRISIGLMAECPACGTYMGCVDEALRICRECGTEARLNVEEIHAAIAA